MSSDRQSFTWVPWQAAGRCAWRWRDRQETTLSGSLVQDLGLRIARGPDHAVHLRAAPFAVAFVNTTRGMTTNGRPSSNSPPTGIALEQSRTAAPFVFPSAATRTGIVRPDLASLTGGRDTLNTQCGGLRLNACNLRMWKVRQT